MGGLGLFFLGMNILAENLKSLASRRLRVAITQWTGNRFAGMAWGVLAGGTTQNMAALVFITVGMLKSGLLSIRRALPIIIGGNLGVTILVLILTLNIRLLALYMRGVAAMVMLSEHGRRYRSAAAAGVGMAMMFLGLVLIKDAAAPLADEAWFKQVLTWSETSLLYSYVGAALLTFVLQSSIAVCVLGISMAAVGALSVDQAIMYIYGCCLGTGLITCVLSMKLTGHSRQVAMFQVAISLTESIVLVPLFYAELYLGVPLMKAAVSSMGLPLGQQLAMVFILVNIPPAIILMATMDRYIAFAQRRWPSTVAEKLSRLEYLHEHAVRDLDTAIVLTHMEQSRMLGVFSRYLNSVREGTSLVAIREAATELLSGIHEFLVDLDERHPNNAVLLVLHDALVNSNEDLWSCKEQLTRDRRELMHHVVSTYVGKGSMLREDEKSKLIRIASATEQVFALLSSFCLEVDRAPTGPSLEQRAPAASSSP